jgi:hypothetical protein
MRKLASRLVRYSGDGRNSLARTYRRAWLFLGIPCLVVIAAIIGARRDTPLVHFLYWLAAVWIVLVRYVEAGAASGESLQPNRSAIRQWSRFSVILGAAAISLYVLVRSLVAWRLS